MTRTFASQGDLSEKNTNFTEIGPDMYALTAEGDPNSGVIIGDDSVMVIEAQATPRLAQKVVGDIRTVTNKPISHVMLTHGHAARVFGTSVFVARGIDTPRIWTAGRDQQMWQDLQG
jgi:glyoxylase-like metal-dependent hydrolase (beta-lactamase superfamily II)